MFALINPNEQNLVSQAFPYSHGGATVEGIRYYSQLKNVSAKIADPNALTFVKFQNIEDPKTIKMVCDQCDPMAREAYGESIFNFAEAFGSGVRLNDIAVEMTKEPVSKGIATKYLPWLDSLKGGYLHGGFSSRGAPFGLHGGHFKTGNY